MAIKDILFSIKWRIPRAIYFKYLFFTTLICFIPFRLQVALISFDLLNSENLKLTLVLLSTLSVIILYVINFFLIIKRLHDLNKSWWAILWLIVPFMNIYYSLILLFQKWTDWENKYWKDPLKTKWISTKVLIENNPTDSVIQPTIEKTIDQELFE
jgi:uncharacterized membrane protein YhaH (DUF805 family)